jgi:hypothetical protein
LRYKDYHLLKKGEVPSPQLAVELGTVKELTSMKELGAFLEGNEEIYEWWRVHMGYKKEDGGP